MDVFEIFWSLVLDLVNLTDFIEVASSHSRPCLRFEHFPVSNIDRSRFSWPSPSLVLFFPWETVCDFHSDQLSPGSRSWHWTYTAAEDMQRKVDSTNRVDESRGVSHDVDIFEVVLSQALHWLSFKIVVHPWMLDRWNVFIWFGNMSSKSSWASLHGMEDKWRWCT